MNATQSKRKAKSGSIQIKNSHNRLQLVFSHGGKRHYISLGLSSTPLNRKIAKDKAFEIQRDIEYGEFDPTYRKYKSHTSLTNESSVDDSSVADVNLSELWEQFVVAKKTGKSPATVRMYAWITNHVERCPYKSLDDSQAIFDWLVANVPADSTKRLLTYFSACCKWAKRSHLIDDNPFEGMASEIKLKKVSNDKIEIHPFTREERDKIIAAFENNRHHKYYAPLVKFLFLTGCRPSEALGLAWNNIGESTITFSQAVVFDGKGPVLKQGLKTQRSRKFPINSQLRTLLESIRSEQNQAGSFVFTSRKQKLIDWGNFSSGPWKTVMASLTDIKYRNPYQTRHTFCSLCREADISSIQVAKWVGNSARMIDRTYAKPIDQIQVPEL